MSDPNDVFALAAAEEEAPVTDDSLSEIAELARQQLALDTEIANLEATLKEKKEEFRRISEQSLPEALDSVGMSEFTLDTGFKIKVSTFYNASIPPDRKEEAYQWLDDNGHGGMIKTEVKTNFGRGELEAAKALIAEINENHPEIAMDLNQTVHWQTLRAWVKEQVEGGHSLPIDMFGVFVGRKTKITLAASKTR